ncbi:hypothetical protein IID10_10015, partial [candidate division KSB1 bacterium]|nr:hypothetical protein [candidate division KSB1 bacterium]
IPDSGIIFKDGATGSSGDRITITTAGNLTFNQASTISTTTGILTITGDDGVIINASNTAGIVANFPDNIANALDIQQGSDNYLNINTTNSSENISFGNAARNPSFSFLGSGTTTFTGDIALTNTPGAQTLNEPNFDG